MNKTLFYFEEICKIPRPSGHEQKICEYLQNFAKERNLEYFVDDVYNVVIKKKSNCNKTKTLILQAHSDMVCEKDPTSSVDFLNDGIKTVVDGDFLKADKTTLGADNGVGLSMILSLLDDNSLQIPNLECVFTTQEETTMKGAMNLNTNLLEGKHLLSIDGTDEGKIEVSSAGMTVFESHQNFENILDRSKSNDCQNNDIFEISLTGFRGGHSGSEINSNKLNSIKIAGEILSKLKNKLRFVKIDAGNKSNAIPRDFNCIVLAQNLTKLDLEICANNVLNNYKNIEQNAKVEIKSHTKNKSSLNNYTLTIEQSNMLIDFISNFKNGVLTKNDQNFVVTSNNLASINVDNGKVKIVVSLRSSNITQDKSFENKILNYFKGYNFDAKITSRAPFFERNKNSYLQPLCKSTYKQLFNKDATCEDIHAGLEGGVFAKKIPNLDICVIAPNIFDAHSPSEKVSISSIKRVYTWLENIVEKF